MNTTIFHLIDGAKRAEGLTVIIDVFRAFSMECWLYDLRAKEIRPTGNIEDTFSWRKKDPDCILAGERQGKKIEGCDLGNSPSSVDPEIVRGKRIIHTTSAGTQGIVNAVHADEILTGSFVNAKATAAYILEKAPEKVIPGLHGKGRRGTRGRRRAVRRLSPVLAGGAGNAGDRPEAAGPRPWRRQALFRSRPAGHLSRKRLPDVYRPEPV